ncbi:MAG: hypothetical protein ACLT1W_15710 [Alistipes onderdonkii]
MKINALLAGLWTGGLLLCASAAAQTVNSDAWAATDALGRKVREYDEAGNKNKDKFVAMFYWTWHQGNDDTTYQIRNISEIVRQYPEAMKNNNHPAWGEKQPGFFFWEQPLLGYYRTTDPWVLRKHAEMLADAGVDAVFFDCTNASLTWQDSYEALLKTWDQAQKDGVNVPKIAFMLPLARCRTRWCRSVRSITTLQAGPLREPVVRLEGKPCIMAYPDNLTDSPEDRAIAEFFTFRPGQPDYVDGPWRNDQWAWSVHQHGYVKRSGEIRTGGRRHRTEHLAGPQRPLRSLQRQRRIRTELQRAQGLRPACGRLPVRMELPGTVEQGLRTRPRTGLRNRMERIHRRAVAAQGQLERLPVLVRGPVQLELQPRHRTQCRMGG